MSDVFTTTMCRYSDVAQGFAGSAVAVGVLTTGEIRFKRRNGDLTWPADGIAVTVDTVEKPEHYRILVMDGAIVVTNGKTKTYRSTAGGIEGSWSAV